jgi:hypothetical protein
MLAVIEVFVGRPKIIDFTWEKELLKTPTLNNKINN